MSTQDQDCPFLIPKKPDAFQTARLAICDLKRFKRRHTTKWTARECSALSKAMPITPEDWALIFAYYNADLPEGRDYRRRDIQTLLNNWPSEVDRARQFVATVKQPAKTDYSKF